MHTKSLTLRLWDKIIKNSKKYSLFKNNDKILLAVSGGPESVFMLDFFAKYARKRQIKLLICHLNHQIRGKNADRDENFVRKLGKIYEIETITKKINVPLIAKRKKTSIEHASRTTRYDLFLKIAKRKNFNLIATAHHSDDNVETILLNLIRGTELKGLCGIPVKRILWKKGRKKIEVIRPIICISRNEIMKYLKLNQQHYKKDETNLLEKYTRNWLRKKLIPLIEKKQPQFRAHLTEFAYKLSKISGF
jgi:tRNA(Ile)-lysidine synthase